MLTVEYTDDEKILDGVYQLTCRNQRGADGINALLLDGGNPIGFCKMALIDDGCEIVDFAVADFADTFLTRDFFFRAVLYKLSRAGVKTLVKTDDKRLEQFGFRPENGYMTVAADDVQFPSACGGNH